MENLGKRLEKLTRIGGSYIGMINEVQMKAVLLKNRIESNSCDMENICIEKEADKLRRQLSKYCMKLDLVSEEIQEILCFYDGKNG